jgi:hypothetical protein
VHRIARSVVRPIVVALLIAAGTVFGSAQPSSAASLANSPVTLQTSVASTMLPGQQGWIALNWKGSAAADACDFRVTAAGTDGVTVTYPSSRTGTSGYTDSTLSQNELDYTALNVSVPPTLLLASVLTLTVDYGPCSPGNSDGNGIGNANGQKTHMVLVGTLPVLPNLGPAVTQVTTTAGPVKAGAISWVDVSYKGASPSLTNFSVKATDGGPFTVGYANEATTAKLSEGATLGVLKTDHVSIRLDATTVPTGTYNLKLQASYGSGLTSGVLSGVLAVTVT